MTIQRMEHVGVVITTSRAQLRRAPLMHGWAACSPLVPAAGTSSLTAVIRPWAPEQLAYHIH